MDGGGNSVKLTLTLEKIADDFASPAKSKLVFFMRKVFLNTNSKSLV